MKTQDAWLTLAGLAVLRDMWPFHRDGIARCFARHLSGADAKQLTAIFGRMADVLDPLRPDGNAPQASLTGCPAQSATRIRS